MSNQHPYPAKIVEAVSDAIANLYADAITGDQVESADDRVADVALQALWDASRVDSIEQVKKISEDAIYIAKDGVEHDFFTLHMHHANDALDLVLPARVIYWRHP